MLHRKIDEIFKELTNVFGIADDILALSYDTNEVVHNNELSRALQICRKENLKLNKVKSHFECASVPSLVRLFPGTA